jgi:hypothetical protein
MRQTEPSDKEGQGLLTKFAEPRQLSKTDLDRLTLQVSGELPDTEKVKNVIPNVTLYTEPGIVSAMKLLQDAILDHIEKVGVVPKRIYVSAKLACAVRQGFKVVHRKTFNNKLPYYALEEIYHIAVDFVDMPDNVVRCWSLM